MEAITDASQQYEAKHRARHLEREGFRINELTLTPSQTVPWHYHNHIQDTFYMLEGSITIFMQQPKEEISLNVGETYSIPPHRPHLVTNSSDKDNVTFLVLQGVGTYDYVPL